jgi:hypothetical protein
MPLAVRLSSRGGREAGPGRGPSSTRKGSYAAASATSGEGGGAGTAGGGVPRWRVHGDGDAPQVAAADDDLVHAGIR